MQYAIPLNLHLKGKILVFKFVLWRTDGRVLIFSNLTAIMLSYLLDGIGEMCLRMTECISVLRPLSLFILVITRIPPSHTVFDRGSFWYR